jgi:hypothetical protein
MADLNTMPQIRALETGTVWQPAGGLFAVEGTVYPGAPLDPVPLTNNHYDGEQWCGFASGTVGAVINIADGLLHCECVGYPALTANMGASAAVGALNTALRIDAFAKSYFAQFGYYPQIWVVGWSQGAWVLDLVWRQYVLASNGLLNYLKNYFWSIYNYGDVFRCSAISRGNDYGGFAPPGKVDNDVDGGIAGPEQLTVDETNIIAPDGRFVIKSFNHHGDLYGDAPMGANPQKSLPAAGKVEYSFFKMIETTSAFTIVSGFMGDILHVIGDVEAAANAIKFFSAAQNAPHFNYWDEMTWVANDIVQSALTLPHQL